MRRSLPDSGPSRLPTCPVARMQAAIRLPSRFGETASREPLGMLLTLLTTSSPWPGPTTRASRSCRGWRALSSPGGTIPEAMTAAFSKPR